MNTATCSQSVFNKNLDQFSKIFADAGAIQTWSDGFQSIDEIKVPAGVISAYRGLVEYGYANGLI